MLRNNRLSYRLFIIVSLVMSTVFICSYLINNYLVERYLIYKNHSTLNKVYDDIKELDFNKLSEENDSIEKKYDVTIIWFDYYEDESYFNEEVRYLLNKEKLTLNRIWLIENTIKKLGKGQKIDRLYDQGVLKSRILVRFFLKEGKVIVIGKTIPDSKDIIHVFNEINLFVWSGTLITLIAFIWWYMKRVTKPIEMIKDKSQEIANLKFSHIEVKTGDELEELANSINTMSNNLANTLKELDMKNEHLENLISDISHEMKTPLSLINIYAHGVQDDLDDGTYVEGIIRETKKLSDLISELLDLSRLEQEKLSYSQFHMYEIISKILEEFKVFTKEKGVSIEVYNRQECEVYADKDKIETVMRNVIFNAIKYTTNKKVTILLGEKDDRIDIQVSNGVNEEFKEEELRNIFNPFYVMDSSRNKEISGNGLGLAIVKSILDKHNGQYQVYIEDKKFIFHMLL